MKQHHGSDESFPIVGSSCIISIYNHTFSVNDIIENKQPNSKSNKDIVKALKQMDHYESFPIVGSSHISSIDTTI